MDHPIVTRRRRNGYCRSGDARPVVNRPQMRSEKSDPSLCLVNCCDPERGEAVDDLEVSTLNVLNDDWHAPSGLADRQPVAHLLTSRKCEVWRRNKIVLSLARGESAVQPQAFARSCGDRRKWQRQCC